MNQEFTKVVVSRQWDSPNITVAVTMQEIGIGMNLDDFIRALALETGNPTLLLTQASLERKLLLAASDVVRKMKIETKQVM